LASIYFWQNRKNYAPTVWHPTWQILATWQISPPPRTYLRAEHERASLAHLASRAYLSGALRSLSGALRSFSGFLLILPSPNGKLLKKVYFSLVINLSKLPNHDICQVNFSKLLEML
jgi:hypothetical protein